MGRNYFSLLLVLLISRLITACEKGDEPTVSLQYPLADGTFIQDYLVARWDDARWQKELDVLKQAGMHYLVFALTLFSDENGGGLSIYPATIAGVKSKYAADLVENCLRNAKKCGFKVFLGLNFNERWWKADFPSQWLYDQMEIGNRVAHELVARYKSVYGDVMYGWYWVWEVDNLNWTTPERKNMLINALNINIDYLHQLTPDMPFMLCPFVNYRVGPSVENVNMWKDIFSATHFREGDIFAPQDCIGAGGLTPEILDEWFYGMAEAVKSKKGLLFWSDAETFDQRFWTAAPVNRFVKQMQTVSPYVSKILTFSYTHYYSPFQKGRAFHDAYMEYVGTGRLPENESPEPVRNLISYRDSEGKLILNWKEPENKKDLAGYYIFKDHLLIGNLQFDTNLQCPPTFVLPAGSPGDGQYSVCSYTGSGTVSPKQTIILGK